MGSKKNLAELINSIVESITILIRGHIDLAIAEIREAIKNIIKSSILFMIALAMVNLGIIFLFVAIAFWLSEQFNLSSSVGFLITGITLFISALVFVGIGIFKVKKIKGSHKTIDSLTATAESLQSLLPTKK